METDVAARDRDSARFFTSAEPRLRRALVAGFGASVGRAATVDALSWGWEHWDDLAAMANPVGYLYRVGQTAARRMMEGDRRQRALADAAAVMLEPRGRGDAEERFADGGELIPALSSLSVQQRTAVVLVHGHGIPLREVAEMMEISVATVRVHTDRAMERLRKTLEVSDV